MPCERQKKWLLTLSTLLIGFYLSASWAPPSKVDELSYVLPRLFHFSFFEFPYSDFKLFSNVALLPAALGNTLFGANGIGFFNCVICLFLTWQIAGRQLPLFLFIISSSATIAINFIAEGPTGIMYCLTCWLTVALFGDKKPSPYVIGTVAALAVLIKLTSAIIILSLIGILFIFRMYPLKWFLTFTLAGALVFTFGSIDKLAQGHNPFFPVLSLSFDETIAEQKTGTDFKAYRDELKVGIQNNNQSLFVVDKPLKQVLSATIFSMPIYPIGFFLILWGLWMKALRTPEILALLASIALSFLIVIPDIRFSYGMIIGLHILILQRHPEVLRSVFVTRALLPLCTLSMILYLMTFALVSLGTIDAQKFLKHSVGLYELKQYYKQNLAQEGPIANFCSYSKFYFGDTAAHLCLAQKPGTAEELRRVSEKYPDIVFFCMPEKIDDPSFHLEKKFESAPLLGTRRPFSKNTTFVDVYLYRKLPDA